MIRIGFDIGGSKIAAIALGPRGRELARLRRDVPHDYPATLAAVVELAAGLQRGHGPARSIGIGMPGLIGADGALIRVVNLPWLEGRPLRADLQAAVRCPVASPSARSGRPSTRSSPARTSTSTSAHWRRCWAPSG